MQAKIAFAYFFFVCLICFVLFCFHLIALLCFLAYWLRFGSLIILVDNRKQKQKYTQNFDFEIPKSTVDIDDQKGTFIRKDKKTKFKN